jgi:hypothetical protein
MATLHLVKTPELALVPATEEDTELMHRFKQGTVYRMELAEMRNGRFFRKWWALAKIAFDIWAATVPAEEYRGIPVLPDFDRFRKDLTIMAGFFRPVWSARSDAAGVMELRIEPESLQWSKMTEQRFEKLYSATIDAILHKVLPGRGLTEQQLRDWAERVIEFA